MGIEFDWHGIRYGIKIIILGICILVSWTIASREAVEFSFLNLESSALASANSQPPLPKYRKLADGAIVYSSSAALRARRDELIVAKRDFISADLGAMELTVYHDGAPFQSFPILAKGKEGSFFETPSGEYEIKSREENHFSTIGKVWMPWSMHFFGNYFIHGWPYYPDGRMVAESFSGGCIRLATKDAEAVFRLARVGTPVIVDAGSRVAEGAGAENSTADTRTAYFEKIVSSDARVFGPLFSASALLAADFETGQILLSKSADEPRPIASLTKLMTALVALETINRFRVLSLDAHSLSAPGDSGNFSLGDSYRSQDLLYPLILASSNDAAARYEEEVSGFVDIMNQKARAIGLSHTRFTDASGVGEENISTANDLFRFLQFLANRKKPIFTLSALGEYTATSTDGRVHRWVNVNWPIDDSRFLGGKSGSTTPAGETMAAVYSVRVAEGGARPIGIIVLGSRDRIHDIRAVIEYLENNFVYGSVIAREHRTPERIKTGASIYQAIGAWR